MSELASSSAVTPSRSRGTWSASKGSGYYAGAWRAGVRGKAACARARGSAVEEARAQIPCLRSRRRRSAAARGPRQWVRVGRGGAGGGAARDARPHGNRAICGNPRVRSDAQRGPAVSSAQRGARQRAQSHRSRSGGVRGGVAREQGLARRAAPPRGPGGRGSAARRAVLRGGRAEGGAAASAEHGEGGGARSATVFAARAAAARGSGARARASAEGARLAAGGGACGARAGARGAEKWRAAMFPSRARPRRGSSRPRCIMRETVRGARRCAGGSGAGGEGRGDWCADDSTPEKDAPLSATTGSSARYYADATVDGASARSLRSLRSDAH
jgi:hypothetical protein